MESTNRHLAHQLRQKEDALRNQLSYIEEFKMQIQLKANMDASEKGTEGEPSAAELKAQISSLQKI